MVPDNHELSRHPQKRKHYIQKDKRRTHVSRRTPYPKDNDPIIVIRPAEIEKTGKKVSVEDLTKLVENFYKNYNSPPHASFKAVGSTHDSLTMKMSLIYQRLMSGELNKPTVYGLQCYFDVGDDAYENNEFFVKFRSDSPVSMGFLCTHNSNKLKPARMQVTRYPCCWT